MQAGDITGRISVPRATTFKSAATTNVHWTVLDDYARTQAQPTMLTAHLLESAAFNGRGKYIHSTQLAPDLTQVLPRNMHTCSKSGRHLPERRWLHTQVFLG